MCGIVGLFAKSPALEAQLGRHLSAMLATMTDRGPDSAGFALYGPSQGDRIKLTVRAAGGASPAALLDGLQAALGIAVHGEVHDDHLLLAVPADRLMEAEAWLAEPPARGRIVGSGRRMAIYKGVGLPEAVGRRFGLGEMAGTHAIGHTRMATESAVTIDGAHPFSTGPDQCLVHNGSLSNHHAVRRRLEHEGLRFVTENDSEVAAGYLTWRMREGCSLREALEASLLDLDGFYTFVVGTENGFAVLRDPIACKPAVMAETEDYVAFGTEYRALVSLPGIENARVFEPEPATVYAWERA